MRVNWKSFFSVEPIGSTVRSAATYVPFVVFSRGVAFLRTLVVAKLLGDAGRGEFGVYQPGLELVNWIVPVVMFGLGDVAERYASRYERSGELKGVFWKHVGRLCGIGVAVGMMMMAASPWVGRFVWNAAMGRGQSVELVGLCAGTILVLALYQYVAAMLRGVRAFGASAGMEGMGAVLLLMFSCAAAWGGGAGMLLGAYLVSLLVPMVFYFYLLARYLGGGKAPHFHAGLQVSGAVEGELGEGAAMLTYAPAAGDVRAGRFARWTLVRLLCVMTFGFLAIWSVGFLTRGVAEGASVETAGFSMPWRIAQLLGYVAVTLWASTYGIAARAWSHGQVRRAKVQLFRVGKFGGVGMCVVAVFVLVLRGVIAGFLPGSYGEGIETMLPAMLAVFMGYGMVAFLSAYCDLQERPEWGAVVWGSAVAVQVGVVFLPLEMEARWHAVLAAGAGLSVALFLVGPVLLWRPFRMSATGVPMALLAVAPVGLLSPGWVVDWIGPGCLVGVVGFLWVSGLLVRPVDKRWWRKRFSSPQRHRDAEDGGGS